MIVSLIILAVIGFCIALYTYLLELKIRKHPTYKPFCDFSAYISCTKPMKSRYSSIFFFTNAAVSMTFYVLIPLLVIMHERNILLLVVTGKVLISCVLAYILYVKIKSFCLLCTSLYVINFLMLLVIHLRG